MTRTEVWELIVRQLGLDDKIAHDGVTEITAAQLRKFGEPRLLAKMDSFAEIPPPLRQRGWSLLAVANDRYLIGELGVHFKLPENTEESESFSWSNPFDTLDPFAVSGESEACLLALHSGIISDFLGGVFQITNFGRMRTDSYDMGITVREELKSVEVSGVQFELDAGFESDEKVVLLEMKKVPTGSLNLRQLYFPFRHWVERTGKLVVPVFGIWRKQGVDLYRFDFPHIDDLSSAEITSSKTYLFESNKVSIGLLEVKAAEASMRPSDSTYPFPQADNVQKLLELHGLLQVPQTLEDIASFLEFDIRQASYYCNALGFLGLATRREDSKWRRRELPSSGPTTGLIRTEPIPELRLVHAMLNIPPVGQVFMEGNRYARGSFSTEHAISRLRQSDWGSSLSEQTISRRAKTVVSWCRWIDSQVKS